MPKRNHYVWQKGEPTPEVLEKLSEQNAVVEVVGEQQKNTSQIELVQVDDNDLPW